MNNINPTAHVSLPIIIEIKSERLFKIELMFSTVVSQL